MFIPTWMMGGGVRRGKEVQWDEPPSPTAYIIIYLIYIYMYQI